MSWRDDLNYGLAAFGVQIPNSLPIDGWMSRLAERPATNVAVVVSASAALFLYFEKGHNLGVKDLADALLYTSTCLNVGHGAIHPVTKAGKLLGALLMTYGPALAARSLDGKRPEDTHAEVLATLRSILAKMEEAAQDGRRIA